MAAVTGVTGLAFEARIAAGRDTHAICSGDGRRLAASIVRSVPRIAAVSLALALLAVYRLTFARERAS